MTNQTEYHLGRPTAFYVYRTSSNQDISPSTWTTLQFDYAKINYNNCYDTSTYLFTAKISGIYLFISEVWPLEKITASRVWNNLIWGQSGSVNSFSYFMDHPDATFTIRATLMCRMEIGQTAYNQVYHNNDVARQIRNSYLSRFMGYLI